MIHNISFSRLVKHTIFIAFYLFLFTSDTHARDTIGMHLDSMFLSRFVWRGEMWTDDPVSWYTATFRYKGFRSYNFFNVDLTDINNDLYECNEYDFILDYTFSFRHFSLAPGVLHFSSPTDYFEPTTKIILQVKTDLPLHPGLRIRVDPEKSRGSYFILDVYQRVSPRIFKQDIDFYGSLGASQPRYYRRYLGTKTTLTDLLLGMSVPFRLGGDFVLEPVVEFTSLLDSSVRKAQEEKHYKKDAFMFGIRLSRNFEF
ncbi:hypothetical protein LLG96_05860 [bacterium]|nr:hypothetical protein [bacterium]